jgi:hypothetical protein
VAYDRTHLAQNDIATATATIRNNLPKTANMVMVDLGIPPGFELLSEDLQVAPGKDGGSEGRAAGEILADSYAGHSLLQCVFSRADGDGELSAAGQVSHPCAHIPVAGLRVLRSCGERGGEAGAAGGGCAQMMESEFRCCSGKWQGGKELSRSAPALRT